MSFGPEAIGRVVVIRSGSASFGSHPALVRLAQGRCPTEGCSGDHLVIVWSLPPQKMKQTVADPVKSIPEAITRGDLHSLKTLIESNPDLVFCKNSRGETPLHIAGEVNKKPAAELLLSHHADIHAKDNHGSAPLHAALANHGSRDVAELLLINKADVNAQTDLKSTPLDYAILYRLTPLAKLLLDFGADPNIKGYQGSTPLHGAVSYGDEDLVELLLARGGPTSILGMTKIKRLSAGQ